MLEKRSSKFSKIFDGKSLNFEKNLLAEAKHEEEDSNIQKVIIERIKEIDSKQKV